MDPGLPIKVLKPDFVVFLSSGWEWFYLESLRLDPQKNKEKTWGSYQSYYYQNKDGICYIQSRHPARKEEDSHVEALLEILRENAG